MTSTYDTLASRLQSAFDSLDVGADPVLRTSDRSDYQANGVMALAKRLGRSPRDVAEESSVARICPGWRRWRSRDRDS